jgi:hypothetical protein
MYVPAMQIERGLMDGTIKVRGTCSQCWAAAKLLFGKHVH